MKRTILIALILLVFLSPSAYAEDNKASNGDGYESQIQSLDTRSIQDYIDKLNSETSGYTPPLNFKGIVNVFKTGKVSYNIKDMLSGLLKYFLSDVLLNTKLLGQLIILSIICAVLQNMESAFSSDAVTNIAYYACYLVLIILIVKSFSTAISVARDTLSTMSDFMNALLPTLLMLLASVGGIASSSILDPIIMFFVEFVSNAIRNFILPGIFLTAILSIVNNLTTTFPLKRLAGLLKQVCVWSLGLMMTVFIGVVTVRGAAAKTLDQVTAKTLKFAVDNFIPVVGKCLSDAIATVAGYSLILKDAISTVGLLAFLLTCIFPLIKIISMILIYKLAGALIEPISDKRVVDCLNDVGNSMTVIFASVVCASIMFFIMIAIIAAAGKTAVGAG